MRDIKRISPFMDKIKGLWQQHQDLRFHQFLTWLLLKASEIDKSDPFYWEEDKWEQIIEKIQKNS